MATPPPDSRLTHSMFLVLLGEGGPMLAPVLLLLATGYERSARVLLAEKGY